MNWLKKFWVALTTYETPVKEVDELKKARVVKDAIEDATVDLKPLEEGVASGKVKVKETKPKRARKKGRYVGDDKSTPDVNEAWEGGKAPTKKSKPKKKPVKITRVKKK